MFRCRSPHCSLAQSSSGIRRGQLDQSPYSDAESGGSCLLMTLSFILLQEHNRKKKKKDLLVFVLRTEELIPRRAWDVGDKEWSMTEESEERLY